MRKLIIAALAVFAIQAQAAERWVIVGDGGSNVVSGSPVEYAPEKTWAALLSAKTHHQFINIAIGAASFVYVGADLRVQIEAAKALNPDGIIIATGANDWVTGQHLSNLFSHVTAAVNAAKATGKKVVCLTPHYRTDWATRKGPYPGQATARGNPLFTNLANPGVPGYANLIASYCRNAGASVIVGRDAAIGLANVGPLTQFLRVALLPTGHEAMANHVHQQLVNQSLLPVIP